MKTAQFIAIAFVNVNLINCTFMQWSIWLVDKRLFHSHVWKDAHEIDGVHFRYSRWILCILHSQEAVSFSSLFVKIVITHFTSTKRWRNLLNIEWNFSGLRYQSAREVFCGYLRASLASILCARWRCITFQRTSTQRLRAHFTTVFTDLDGVSSQAGLCWRVWRVRGERSRGFCHLALWFLSQG